MKSGFVIFVALLVTASAANAQAGPRPVGPCPTHLDEILKNSGGKDSAELRQFLTFGGGLDCMATLFLTQYTGMETLIDRAQMVKAALQQNGSSAGSGGATSLVSKGITAQVLSAAAEYGA
ncbi:hypothetical protein [Tunturiibacter gelidoferens]|uniref:Uncharacterized protein n=1 Tax=Tunturiibacter gelidiferens TaxID=3069689 RepID=A0ACC5P4E9_9BACT|nr:hypothetical protein [Edaphobacter lichenicola]MBB5341463.1 hypothetical protein [Edaphobacter lichenicola]